MPSQTIRIEEETHKALRELSEQTGKPMLAVLSDAVELYRRERFLKELNASFATLRSTPEWEKEKKERTEWESTLSDGESKGK